MTHAHTQNSPIARVLDAITLSPGGHKNIEEGACLLEAASYLAGEPFSDHPQCVSPVLAAFGRAVNDGVMRDHLDLLTPLTTRLLNTAGYPAIDQQVMFLLANWAVRDLAPRALDAAGLTERAATLRALPPIVDEITAARAEAARAEAAWAEAWAEAAWAEAWAGAAWAAEAARAAAAAGAAAGAGAAWAEAAGAEAAWAAAAGAAAAEAAAKAAKAAKAADIRVSVMDVFKRAIALYTAHVAAGTV